MKKLLILLLAFMLAAPAVMAEAPVYTQEMLAQRIAIAAIKVKYGLTTDMIGLFYPEITVAEGKTRVAFYPSSILPVDRIGVYEVILTDGSIYWSWTHDGEVPRSWQSNDMFSEHWGARQLQACLDLPGIWRFFVDENQETYNPPARLDSVNFTVGTRKDAAMQSSKAIDLANAAVADMYGLTVYEVEALDHNHELELLLLEDGTKLWRVTLSSATRCFSVFINDATGEVFDVIFSTGGNG